jgi:hypothetical protein
MVSYQTMVRLAFDIAEQKGAQFDSISDGGQFLSELSGLWQENKQEIKQMTEDQARRYLAERVTA